MNTPVVTPTRKAPPPPASSSSPPAQANGRRRQQHEREPPLDEEESELARRRRNALAQADAVLDAVGGDYYLDGFNLLGVIANPRGTIAALTPTASYHGRYTSTGGISSSSVHGASAGGATANGTTAAAAAAATTTSTLEGTLSQVTEQLDYFNHMLEDWSRQILEDDTFGSSSGMSGVGGSGEDALPASQLQELPEAMRSLSLTELQSYLEETGQLAHAFQQILQQNEQEQQMLGSGAAATATAATTTTTTSSAEQQQLDDDEVIDVTPEIPPIFFRPDFDLTNPQTFSELLIAADEDDDDLGGLNETIENDDDDDRPISEWFPLLPQDALSGFLDKVELSLLHQVRSKSADFFTESVRFGQLQELIAVLLQQVVELQQKCRQVQQDWCAPMEIVPAADAQRRDLTQLLTVLERCDDMLRTKSSLVGVLSAQDDLLAIEQIQYGRQLLAGTVVTRRSEATTPRRMDSSGASDGGVDNPEPDTTAAPAPAPAPAAAASDYGDDEEEEDEEPIELGRLQSLKGVSEQLNQYEQLVVTKLRDELVEIFMDWNTAAVSSVYAGTTTTTTSNNNNSNVQDRVREIMGALETCHALVQTREVYSHRLQDIIRMTVRTTVGEFAADAASSSSTTTGGASAVSVSAGTTAMSLPRFLDCLDMLFEQLLGLLTSATGVDEFCVAEGFKFSDTTDDNDDAVEAKDSDRQENGEEKTKDAQEQDADAVPASTAAAAATTTTRTTPMSAVVGSAAELTSKSVSELLRLRKEAHSLVTLDEMKSVWDACLQFTVKIEKMSGRSSTLRSTLLAQAKAFVERKHESNMSALVAALDSERWSQCEVSAERQDALTRLCSGRSLVSSVSPRRKKTAVGSENVTMSPEAEVEGTRYKVVWSCLLVVEMITINIKSAAHFSSLSSGIVGKVAELLRLFNSRATHLVLGAGAIHSNAKLKSINAKHLSLVTQCLGMIISILPHIRAALMAQMPKKQHTLLTSLDQIRREYADHNEKVLNKFVTIIGGIVEHGLAPKIAGTDFDARAAADPTRDDDETSIKCCVFLEGVASNTKKMHQVLKSLLPPNHLRDVFSRIFAFVDTKIPALLIAAAEKETIQFSFPNSDAGKRRLLMELEIMVGVLNGLAGVIPWDFTAVQLFERSLEIRLHPGDGEDDDAVEEEEEEESPKPESTTASSQDDDAADEKNGDDPPQEGDEAAADAATASSQDDDAAEEQNGDDQQQEGDETAAAGITVNSQDDDATEEKNDDDQQQEGDETAAAAATVNSQDDDAAEEKNGDDDQQQQQHGEDETLPEKESADGGDDRQQERDGTEPSPEKSSHPDGDDDDVDDEGDQNGDPEQNGRPQEEDETNDVGEEAPPPENGETSSSINEEAGEKEFVNPGETADAGVASDEGEAAATATAIEEESGQS